MLRGFVKNWARAMDAFGNFVSPLTERAMRPLPVTPDLPIGACTTPRLSYSVGLLALTSRTRPGPVW